MTAQTRNTDSDGILCSTHDAIIALRVVLETEDQLRQDFRIHIGQLHWPYFLDHVSGGSGKSTALAHLKGGNQRHGDGPAWSITTHVRLINPCTSQIKTSWQGAGSILDISTRTGCQSLGRSTLQHYILDTMLLAELSLGVAASIFIHYKHIGMQELHRRHKVHDARTGIDECIFHVSDRLYHEQAFLLRIEGFMMLILQDSGIGTYADIQLTILRSLTEKLHMSAVKKVITSAYKYFFHICYL